MVYNAGNQAWGRWVCMDKMHSRQPVDSPRVEGVLRLAGALDSRMMELLRSIAQTGSINQAAKQAGLSYKGAWQMIERANNLSPKVLVATSTGGSKGGGTSLTVAGQSLLKLFDELESQHRQFIAQLNRQLLDNPEVMLLLRPLAVKTSATNQLFGTIETIIAGAVNTEVEVLLKGGERVVATVTNSTVSSFALEQGGTILLIINAPDISLSAEAGCERLSARNCLKGVIIRLQHEDVDSEVVVRLPGGDSLVSTITRQSAEALALKMNKTVYAIFKSNAVMLALQPPV